MADRLGVANPAWIVVFALFALVFSPFPALQAHLSHRFSPLEEEQAVHIIGKVGKRDFGLSALDANGANEQPHMCFLPCKDMFYPRAYFRLGAVGGAQGL